MNRFPIVLVFIFTIIFSAPSYAEWIKVSESDEAEVYVDFSRIRKNGGHVFYWGLFDLSRPTKFGDLSIASYNQGDCALFKWKLLSTNYYKRPMAVGTSEEQLAINNDWHYPAPQSFSETSLEAVCEFAENYL